MDYADLSRQGREPESSSDEESEPARPEPARPKKKAKPAVEKPPDTPRGTQTARAKVRGHLSKIRRDQASLDTYDPLTN